MWDIMGEECEYWMGGMCFHPEKAKNGVIAIPCSECGLCDQTPKSRIVKNSKLQMMREVDAEKPSAGRSKTRKHTKVTSRKPIALEE